MPSWETVRRKPARAVNSANNAHEKDFLMERMRLEDTFPPVFYRHADI
jgi:hypothetical protein